MNSARTVRIVLQARTDSARFPAKVMLPVAGKPLAVLAALRLANTGFETVLATSDRPVDDMLADAAVSAGLGLFRGSVENVLDRVARACADLPDDALIVRATGDNLFPDGKLVARLVDFLEERSVAIAAVRWPESGLPYGVSLEAMRLRALREAASQVTDAVDLEHVTPWVWRSGRSAIMPAASDEDTGRLRATIDHLDDYLRIAPIFHDPAEAVSIPCGELVMRLARRVGEPAFAVPVRALPSGRLSEMVLGTVQLGLDYGRGPTFARPTEDEAVEIVRSAIRQGVTHIDTARAYGASEAVIGKALAEGWHARVHVITKLAPDIAEAGASEREVELATEVSVGRSLRDLRVSKLHTLMLHRPSHLRDWNGAAWRRLIAMKAEGLIGRLGVSVSTPDEMVLASKDEHVELIQFPCNLLDWRWDGVLDDVSGECGDRIELHARSVFLQGLLADDRPANWPGGSEQGSRILGALQSVATQLGLETVKELAVAYMRAKRNVDALVMGMPSMTTLADSLNLFRGASLSREQREFVDDIKPKVEAALLDPSAWPALETQP